MSSVSLQPKVTSGTSFASPLRSPNHSAQKNALSWKSKQQARCALKVYCMKTWNPINNKKFETLSYVPPLSEESIAKEIDFILSKGWVPCLEFDEYRIRIYGDCNINHNPTDDYQKVGIVHRTNSRIPGYYDGRYWTLWKLPMFGCTDSAQVLREIEECKRTYPNAYIKLISFDSNRQCQCMSFVIQKPSPVANETA